MRLLTIVKTGSFSKLLLTVLALCFILTLSAQFGGGQGTEDDPWQIGRPDDLNNIRDYLGPDHNNKYYVMTHNIDMGIAPWNEGEGWVPIGSTAALSFQGNFDGRGFVISNLTINRPGGSYQALFGYTVSATIKNLGLKNVNIIGNNYVAGFSAYKRGFSLIESCYVSGNITGTNYVAGFTGYMRYDEPKIFDCYSAANITTTGTSTSHFAGGIIGYLYQGEIRRCYVTGAMNTNIASSNVGAVIGNFRAAASVQSNLYWNTETINLTQGIGNDQDSPGQTTRQMLMRDTYETFNFDDVWNIAQDVSYPYFQWQGEQPDDHNLRPLLPPRNLLATGANEAANLSWDPPVADFGNPQGYNVYRDAQRVNVELIQATQYQDTGLDNWVVYRYFVKAVFDGEESLPSATVQVVPADFPGGSGTEDDPYHIETPEQLNGIRFVNTAHYRQMAEINLNVAPWNEGTGWVPIGSFDHTAFSGSYDGNGFVIDGLFFNLPTGTYCGLFGATDGAYIYNVGMTNANVTGRTYVGPLVGLVNNATIIENCYSSGVINGRDTTGGLVGQHQSNSIIRDSYSTSTVNGTTMTGGLCGAMAGTPTVINSYSIGDVTGTGELTGGLAGRIWNSTIIDSYSRSTVIGTTLVGGLTGQNRGTSAITNCYASGRVNVAGAGGLVGAVLNTTTFTRSYWDIEATGREISAGGEGRQTRQMVYPYDEDTYVGWNFDEVWVHDVNRNLNDGYPMLHHQEIPPAIDSPVVTVDIITIEEVNHFRLRWNLVEDALSYKIFSTANPHDEDWGDPVRIVGENVSQYTEPIDGQAKKFFYVIASTEEER